MKETAYHEAGHAVVANALGHRLMGVSIASDVPGKLGHSGSDILPDSLKSKRSWLRGQVSQEEWDAACDDIVVHLAGEMAEAQLDGRVYDPDANNPRTSDEGE